MVEWRQFSGSPPAYGLSWNSLWTVQPDRIEIDMGAESSTARISFLDCRWDARSRALRAGTMVRIRTSESPNPTVVFQGFVTGFSSSFTGGQGSGEQFTRSDESNCFICRDFRWCLSVTSILSGQVARGPDDYDDYGTPYETPALRAILSQMPRPEYKQITHDLQACGGVKTRFKRGHETWDKGLKGIHFSPQSEFKKGGPLRGSAARKWRPVGAVTVRYDTLFHWQKKRRYKNGESRKGKPRRWIKVRDDGPPQNRWIPYARYLWEKRNGPVPNGYIVVHKDGNQMHDVIDNLILVDRTGHILRTCHSVPEVLARAHTHAGESRKRNTQARRLLRPQRAGGSPVWHCPACGATYEADNQPDRCPKCSAHSLERITLPRTNAAQYG